jgi:HEPN domain-containing protein
MTLNSNYEAKRWLKQAIEDYETAQGLFKVERYNCVCFLSQQAAEKSLKAFLYFIR